MNALELSEFEACVIEARELALHRLEEKVASGAHGSAEGIVRAELPPKKPKGFKNKLQNFFSGGGGAAKRSKARATGSGNSDGHVNVTLSLSPNYRPSVTSISRGGSLPRGFSSNSGLLKSRTSRDSLTESGGGPVRIL